MGRLSSWLGLGLANQPPIGSAIDQHVAAACQADALERRMGKGARVLVGVWTHPEQSAHRLYAGVVHRCVAPRVETANDTCRAARRA